MVLFELFAFKDADKILENKGLLQEVKSMMSYILFVNHTAIQEWFHKSGWSLENYIFKETLWRWDAYKDKIAVSIELSLIDSVHRDFLRAVLAHKHGLVDALVYVTSMSKEPKFHNVKRDIEIFREILDVPILLIGLEP
jgi:hypothetical protein